METKPLLMNFKNVVGKISVAILFIHIRRWGQQLPGLQSS
jgi:hypothetical protein